MARATSARREPLEARTQAPPPPVKSLAGQRAAAAHLLRAGQALLGLAQPGTCAGALARVGRLRRRARHEQLRQRALRAGSEGAGAEALHSAASVTGLRGVMRLQGREWAAAPARQRLQSADAPCAGTDRAFAL